MANYLLLRDNKEKGPYSFDELVSLGLKPYDLIWIKGKSAAWRYPSEIPELVTFAPVIEEQPYDRFFRKEENSSPVQQQISNPQPSTLNPKPVSQKTESETDHTDLHEAYKPRPSVFVTMPKSNSPKPDISEKKERITPAIPVPVAAQPTITVSENPAAAQIKYSQPLDEIKEMYVKTLQERKQKLAFKTLTMQSLKKAGVILLFVTAGVFAGFMIKSNKDSGTLVQSSVATEPKQEVISADKTLADVEEFNQHSGDEFPSGIPEESAKQKENISPVTLMPPAKNILSAEDSKQLLSSHVVKGEKDIAANYEFQKTETDPQSGERIRKTRDSDNREPNTNARTTGSAAANTDEPVSKKSGISSQVSVKANEYRIVAFGGIRDLHLTVTNDSKFPLDEVVVELQYLKPSEQPLRTDNIRFKSIAPNSSATLKIPDTNRGIKVSYRILRVSSDAAENAGM
jgi:hypothetical protein